MPLKTFPRAAAMLIGAGAMIATTAALAQDEPAAVDIAAIPAGTYVLDADHGKISWSVSHLGFSTYRGQFPALEATLTLDPARPEDAKVSATIDLTRQGTLNDALDAHLKTADFFDVANHPQARFVTDRVTILDADSAVVDGQLTLRGVTRPVRFAAEFNKAGVNPLDKRFSLGFDGYAAVRRSDFGVDYALPMVSDTVNLHLEGEFKLQTSE